MLLARHRKSVFGKGFIGELGSENLATHRNSTLIEVLIATSLYYLRSYYPNLPHLSNDDIVANREVKKVTFSQVRSLLEHSCVILISFKVLVIFNSTSADIKTKTADVILKMTTISKEMRIAQL